MRTRIAEHVTNPSTKINGSKSSAVEITNSIDEAEDLSSEENDVTMTKEQRVFLDKIAEALARLGRVKRVGLGVEDKKDFIAMWTKTKRK